MGLLTLLSTVSFNYKPYSAIVDIHTFQFTVVHALWFSVSTSRFRATDLNTEAITSNHYEVFLPFLIQPPWPADSLISDLRRINSPILSPIWSSLRSSRLCTNHCWVSELYYDRRSVGQSVLVSSTHLGLMTRFLLLSDNCGFVDVGRPLWREVGSVLYYVQCTIY
jgi:hypothetical protein